MNTKAKLPALPRVATGDQALDRWIAAVAERLEVREGSRGDPMERVLTVRDLGGVDLPRVGRALGGGTTTTAGPGDLVVDVGGVRLTVTAQQFAQAITQSSLYRSLMQRIDDPARFAGLAKEIRQVLDQSILDEAVRRGADIRRTQTLIQDQARSLAFVSEELTAALGTTNAGLREVQLVSATRDEARAEQITQLEARLMVDVASDELLPPLPDAPYATLAALLAAVPVGDPDKFYRVAGAEVGDPEKLYHWNGTTYVDAGEGLTARIEERMSAVASRTSGVESQYTLKLNAGGAAAGIGLAATSSTVGVGTSALLLQADKIAFVGSSETVGTGPGEIDPANPSPTRIPFGVDAGTGTVFINGSLKVGGATGPTLDEIASEAGIYLSYSSQFFKYDTAGAPVNTSVTLTANVTGSLTGTLEWAALSGYSGSMPADVTVTAAGAVSTATINVANMTGDTAAFSITLTDGATVYTDFVTLVKLRDGADAYTARLTNDSAGVACNSSGAPVSGGFGAATGTMEVYRGGTKLTSGVTYSIAANDQGVTASINSSTGAYSATAKGSWPDATKTAVITLRAVVAGGPTLTKDFVLTKALQGVSGFYSDYVFIRSASAPSAPSTASEPTAQGWSDAPPAGSNPLYMSTALRDVLTNAVSGSWSTPVRLDGAAGATGAAGQYVEAQYAKNSSSTTAPTSGYTTAPPSLGAGEYLWMQTRVVVPPAAAPAWGTAVRISGEQGDAGAAGQNVAQVFAYRRSATALTTAHKPGGTSDGSGGASSYTFSTKTLTLPTGTGWASVPPAGTDPLYVTVATAASATDSDSIPVAEWSTPVKLADNGANGANGLNAATVYLYMRTASATAPTITNPGADATWTFSTKALTGTLPTSAAGTWSTTIPASGGQYLWATMATAASTTDTDAITYTEWSAARLLSYNGTDGEPGDSLDIVFIRSATQPVTPAASPGTPSGWYTDVNSVPAGADPMWSSVGQRAGAATNYVWQTPVKIQGSDGAPGLTIAELTIYTRGVPTTTPSGGTYNFGTKVLSPLPTSTGATWSVAVPAGTGPVYTSRATVSIQGTTGTASVTGWTAPVISFQDGATAKTAILTADSLVFKANAANVVQTPDFIKLEVLKQNTTANVTWSTSPTVPIYIASAGGGAVTQNTPGSYSVAYLRKADFGTNTKVTVTTVCDGITDAVTLVRTVDGVDAPVVAMSNPSHALPSDSAGTVASYSGSGTTLQVFVGGTACTITAVARTATGITAGAVSGTGTTTATIAAHSAATADTARVEYAITYTKPDGTAGTAYAAQAIYKQKAGATGGPGSTGVRGNIVTKISGAWNATTAAAQVASIASAAGAVPTTPIKGDIVSYTGGAKECSVAGNPGTWVDVAAYIDGSLVVTGTIAAAQLAADAINGKTISVENTGHIRGGQTDYNTGKGFFLGYSGGQHKVSFGKGALTTGGANASTNAITLTNHGYVEGDYTIFSSNGGATGLLANTPYVVWSAPTTSTFYVGSYNTDFYAGGTGGVTYTDITANGTPVIAPTGLLWDGNSVLFNGEFRLGQGLLSTGAAATNRWVLDRGELRGMTSTNKQLLTLGVGANTTYIRMRSDSDSGIPLQVMRSVAGVVPVAWVKGAQAGVPVMSVVNDSGTALELTGNSATEATLEVTNSNASGVAVEANGRVEASKTLRVTGTQPPSSGVGLEIAYYGGIGYVISYNRNPTAPLGPPAPRPLHMISSETVLGGVTNVPPTATSAGTQGQIAWDANYAYFCTAPNTWRRVALAGW